MGRSRSCQCRPDSSVVRGLLGRPSSVLDGRRLRELRDRRGPERVQATYRANYRRRGQSQVRPRQLSGSTRTSTRLTADPSPGLRPWRARCRDMASAGAPMRRRADRILCPGRSRAPGASRCGARSSSCVRAVRRGCVPDPDRAGRPQGVSRERVLRREREFLYALADALRVEYELIVDAGFVLQVDDAWLPRCGIGSGSRWDWRRSGALPPAVQALNHALAESRGPVRYTCAGGAGAGPTPRS